MHIYKIQFNSFLQLSRRYTIHKKMYNDNFVYGLYFSNTYRVITDLNLQYLLTNLPWHFVLVVDTTTTAPATPENTDHFKRGQM